MILYCLRSIKAPQRQQKSSDECWNDGRAVNDTPLTSILLKSVAQSLCFEAGGKQREQASHEYQSAFGVWDRIMDAAGRRS
jgi:hypothetical protein